VRYIGRASRNGTQKYLKKKRLEYRSADRGENDSGDQERRMEYTVCLVRYQSENPNVERIRSHSFQ
jgi:hypothetical protein